MKIRYSRRRNALVRRPAAVTIAIAAVVAVIVLMRLFVPSAFARMAAPLFSAGTYLSHGVSGIGTMFADRASLASQRDAALAAQSSLVAQNQTLSAKVADLEALVGTRKEAAPGILAGVLARPPVVPYDTLVIDAGSDEGVAQDAPVFGPNGVPVGTISSVTASDARVSLYSAPGRQTSALIGASRTPVTLMGQGAGAFTATVSRDAGLAVGDAVFVSGPGLQAIGTVSSIQSDPSSPSSALLIKPYVSPFTLSWVTISPQ